MQDAESGQPQEMGAQDEFVVDDEVQTPPEPSQEELDGMRIRRIAEMRRSACRSASYCIIGALACWVMTVQLVWLWICHVWVGGWQWGQIGYGVAMGVLARVGMKLWGRGRELRNEANGTQLQEPSSAPDFTSLNNGGEPWKNLERLQ